MQRTSPLSVLAFGVAGIAAGLLIQLIRSTQGSPPMVPPVSLAATLLVISAVLIVLAILLRRAVLARAGARRPEGDRVGAPRSSMPRRAVNPFHAVRLLAGARAGQFAGALFAGLGGGSLLQLLTRSIMPPAATWGPMVLVLVAGAVLVVCGIIAELLCRVPPGESETDAPENEADAAGEAGFTP